ncbi:hypothetical protein ZIOFF_045699 [Zingiber officinale]|uniref:Pyruvate kinase n=1 Tax=Zingiber officinale TaxID=94328 RepID=A0A8J5FZ16_ZINOF|nr:hypothetical protein ZIOFF_045699 [Zingiber officinale]
MQVMLDTVGPELQVVNKSEKAISLEVDGCVVLTPDQEKEASPQLLPVNFSGLPKAGIFLFMQCSHFLKCCSHLTLRCAVKPGDTIFIGQYLFTGSETTSLWLEISHQRGDSRSDREGDFQISDKNLGFVRENLDGGGVAELKGEDVVCRVKNSATLAGSLFTLHISQIRIDLPTLTENDKHVICTWGVCNKIDFLSLSYTRHAEDVRQARQFLSELSDLAQTQIFAKIENIEGLTHFDEILQEADGIILSRGNLGMDLPPEKVRSFILCD